MGSTRRIGLLRENSDSPGATGDGRAWYVTLAQDRELRPPAQTQKATQAAALRTRNEQTADARRDLLAMAF